MTPEPELASTIQADSNETVDASNTPPASNLPNNNPPSVSPTRLSLVPGATSIEISLTGAALPADHSFNLRRALGSTPSTQADGDEVCTACPNNFTDTGLEVGETYYYSAFVLDGDDVLVDTLTASGMTLERWSAASLQEAYIKASNGQADDRFGHRVAVSGDGLTLAVGAYFEGSSATGVDGDGSLNDAGRSGAVYVFQKQSGNWIQQAYIKASNTDAQDFFGYSVSLSTDGDTLAVGAYREDSGASGVGGDDTLNTSTRTGAAYVFTRSASSWTQQAYVKASNPGNQDYFGFEVALSGDGNTLAVGALYEDSSASGVDGDQSNNSASDAGAAYVYTRSGASWSQQAYIKASNPDVDDFFGYRVALSQTGDTLVVGARGEDSSATGIGGDGTLDDASESGAAYVFQRSGTNWTQEAYIKASNTGAGDRFGYAVDLSADGNALVVGAYREGSSATGIGGDGTLDDATESGAAYLFRRDAGTWSEEAYVKASNTDAGDWFGNSVAVNEDGSSFAVGASNESSSSRGVGANQGLNDAAGAGAVYIFEKVDTNWSQSAYLKADNADSDDAFGLHIALSDDASLLAVGAFREDSSALGLNSDGSLNDAVDAGAAYIFAR